MNDTGRQRKTSQLVVSRVLAAVYSIWELLFVWCLQSGRCSQLFWELTLRCSPAVVWLGLAFSLTPASVSRSVPLPPPRLPLGHLWLTTLQALTQSAADSSLPPSEGRGCENALFLKRSKNTRDPAKPGLSALQTVAKDVTIVAVLTHSNMESGGPRTWANGCICCTSLGRQQQQKLLGFFICQVKRYVVVRLSLFSFHP